MTNTMSDKSFRDLVIKHFSGVENFDYRDHISKYIYTGTNSAKLSREKRNDDGKINGPYGVKYNECIIQNILPGTKILAIHNDFHDDWRSEHCRYHGTHIYEYKKYIIIFRYDDGDYYRHGGLDPVYYVSTLFDNTIEVIKKKDFDYDILLGYDNIYLILQFFKNYDNDEQDKKQLMCDHMKKWFNKASTSNQLAIAHEVAHEQEPGDGSDSDSDNESDNVEHVDNEEDLDIEF
jgi:hypothetical protein